MKPFPLYRQYDQMDCGPCKNELEQARELPAAYRVKDLAALIPGLVDAFGNQNGLDKVKVNSDSGKN